VKKSRCRGGPCGRPRPAARRLWAAGRATIRQLADCPYSRSSRFDFFTPSAPLPYRHHPLGETGWGVGATPARPTSLAGGDPRIRGCRFPLTKPLRDDSLVSWSDQAQSVANHRPLPRGAKHTRPRAEGRGRQQKDCFLYDRSHQLVENKGLALKNEAKTNLKRT